MFIVTFNLIPCSYLHDCTIIMQERYSDNNDINKDGTILYIEQEGVAYNNNML